MLSYLLIGEEAKKLYKDAQTMLNDIISKKLLTCCGKVAFYKANSVGDDIEIYDDNGQILETFHGLRQQVKVLFHFTYLISALHIRGIILSNNTIQVNIEEYEVFHYNKIFQISYETN